MSAQNQKSLSFGDTAKYILKSYQKKWKLQGANGVGGPLGVFWDRRSTHFFSKFHMGIPIGRHWRFGQIGYEGDIDYIHGLRNDGRLEAP